MKIILFIINIIQFPFLKSYITLPFKKKLKNLSNENIISSMFENSLLTNITLGTPQITLEVNIKTYKTPFHISCYYCKNLNITFFDERNSTSFNYYDPEDQYFSNEDILNGGLSYDNFIIGEEKIKINNLDFYCASSINFISSGVLGLGIKSNDMNAFHSNFIKNLKIKDFIQKYDFFFEFNNSNEGNLIIGELPHIYNSKKYNFDSLKYFKIEISEFKGQYFDIGFENLTFGNNNIFDKFFIGKLKIENGLIKANKNFGIKITDFFFKKYLKNNICKFNNFTIGNINFSSFICDLNLDIKKFEDINFSILNFENAFYLSYEDVFIKYNEKYYFLIYFNFEEDDKNNFWELGEIFFRKFQFVFNQDSKTIGYYFKDKKKENKTINFFFSLPWILLFFCFFIILFMGYVIVYLIRKNKFRKRRANELNDEFDYINYQEEEIIIN